MGLAMDDDIVDRGLDIVEFHDMSERYFHVSPVPRDWYAEKTRTITDLRQRSDREDLLGALGSTLSDVAPGNLVVIDSLSDLIATRTEEVSWSDINFLVKGLQKAAHEWDGLILLHLNHETLTPTEFGQLSGGRRRDDALRVGVRRVDAGAHARRQTVPRVLSQIENEDIVRFETDIGDAGFDISDVRKIR